MSGTITKILSALAGLFRRSPPSPAIATTQAVTGAGADDLGCDGINTGPCDGGEGGV
jgi:hypothetical protein